MKLTKTPLLSSTCILNQMEVQRPLYNSLRQKKGFALVLFVSLLCPFLIFMTCLFQFLTFFKIEIETTHLCRRENLKTQDFLVDRTRDLLSLNPLALRLQMALKVAQAKEAAALASFNSIAAAAAAVEIKKIMMSRNILHKKQLFLIQEANNFILERAQTTNALLMESLNNRARALSGHLRVDVASRGFVIPTLAINPKSLDLAPEYQVDLDAYHKQVIAHRWQYQIKVLGSLQKYTKGQYFFKKSCAASIDQIRQRWIPILVPLSKEKS